MGTGIGIKRHGYCFFLLNCNTVNRHRIARFIWITTFGSIVLMIHAGIIVSMKRRAPVFEGTGRVPVTPTVGVTRSARRVVIVNGIINGGGAIAVWRALIGVMRVLVHTVHLYGRGRGPGIDARRSGWLLRGPVGGRMVHARGGISAHHRHASVGVSVPIGSGRFGGEGTLFAAEINADDQTADRPSKAQCDAYVKADGRPLRDGIFASSRSYVVGPIYSVVAENCDGTWFIAFGLGP